MQRNRDRDVASASAVGRESYYDIKDAAWMEIHIADLLTAEGPAGRTGRQTGGSEDLFTSGETTFSMHNLMGRLFYVKLTRILFTLWGQETKSFLGNGLLPCRYMYIGPRKFSCLCTCLEINFREC